MERVIDGSVAGVGGAYGIMLDINPCMEGEGKS